MRRKSASIRYLSLSVMQLFLAEIASILRHVESNNISIRRRKPFLFSLYTNISPVTAHSRTISGHVIPSE